MSAPICYQCEQETDYLFDDGRCGGCTRLTPEEVRGDATREHNHMQIIAAVVDVLEYAHSSEVKDMLEYVQGIATDMAEHSERRRLAKVLIKLLSDQLKQY